MTSRLQRVKLIRKASRVPNHSFYMPTPFRSAVTSFFEALRQHPEPPSANRIQHLLQPVPPPNQYDRVRALEFLRDEAALSYKIAARVLTELRDRTGLSNPRVLDFGSGVGSAAWAAAEVFDLHDKVGAVTAIEPVKTMAMLGKAVSHGLGDAIVWKEFVDEAVLKQKFDLVILSFVAGEMNAKNIKEVSLQMWNLINPNGYLVIVEPGDEAGFKRAAQIRSVILDQFPPSNKNKNAAFVVAPCPHDGKCPLYERTPKSGTFKGLVCKFPQRITLTDLPRGNILRKYKSNPQSRFSNEYAMNFSYMILGKGFSPRLSMPSLTANTMADDPDGIVSNLIQAQEQEQIKRLESSKKDAFEPPSRYEDDHLGEDFNHGNYSLDDFKYLRGESEEAEHSEIRQQRNSLDSDPVYIVEEDSDDDDEEESEIDESDRIYQLFGSRNSGVTLHRQTYSFDRLLRKPLKRKGHIIIDTCSKRERIERRVVSRSHGQDRYKQAKKSRWGDLWGWE